MQPAEVNLTIHKGTVGTTFGWSVVLTDADDGSNFDLTGYSCRVDARTWSGAATPVITTEGVDANITATVDVPTATITLEMTPEQVGDLDFEAAIWKLEIYTAADAAVWLLFYGTIILDTHDEVVN